MIPRAYQVDDFQRGGHPKCKMILFCTSLCPHVINYSNLIFVLGSMAMELSDANLQTLTEYLKKTLDPDPAIRRPGKVNKYSLVVDLFLKGR